MRLFPGFLLQEARKRVTVHGFRGSRVSRCSGIEIWHPQCRFAAQAGHFDPKLGTQNKEIMRTAGSKKPYRNVLP